MKHFQNYDDFQINQMEKKSSESIQSQIVVIGAQVPVLRSYATFSEKLALSESVSNAGKWSNPQTISNHNGLIALIDQKNDLWIFDNSFSTPINITDVLRMKAKRFFLGEGQLIFENKRKLWILVNWNGKIDIDQSKLRKVNIHHNPWNNSIDAYFLDQDCQEGSIWYYSSTKKVENTLKIYLIRSRSCQIIGFPARKVIKLPEKIAGMSLGKYHGLCWTITGRIFAWGSKNLAMGLRHYQKGFYDDAQQIMIKQPIFKALAGTNYSLALTNNGNLYQWGTYHLDYLRSEIGEPILTPSLLNIKNKKFLDLKGYENMFVGLTSANELICWGKQFQRYFNVGNSFDNPFVVPKQKNVKIYDYHVQQNCIITLIGKDTGVINKDERHYFAQVVRKVSQKWLPNRLTKDINRTSYSKFKNDAKQNESSIQFVRKNEDYIDRLICNQMNKQDYFNIVQNQQAMFRKIMQEKTARSSIRLESVSFIKDTSSNHLSKLSKSKVLKLHRKVQSARQTPDLTLDIQSSTRVIRQYEAQQATIRNNRKKCKMPVTHRRENSSYQARLEAVLYNRAKIEQKKKQEMWQAAQKRLQAEKKQREQARIIQIAQQKHILYRLKKVLSKKYVCLLLMTTIDYGREIKIKDLINASNQRAGTYSINKSLLKNRALIFIKILKTVQPSKYQIVAKVIVRAVQRWRKKKYKAYRRQIINQLIIFSIKKRIETGLSHVWLAARKIQKVANWVNIQQKERSCQLKMLWKKSLLLYLKPTPSFQNKKPSICKQDLNYKLSNDRSRNPRLSTYLSSSPICKLKLLKIIRMRQLQKSYVQSLHLPPSILTKDLKIKKGVSWAQKEVSEIRGQSLDCEEKRLHTTFASPLTDILLYSQHYDYFYKPKNYQINIPDSMKQSEKWIAEEKKILNKIIKQILFHQLKKFFKDLIQYQQKLAYFIKENYQTLTEFRWKYLIQFNKIKDQNNLNSIKNQKQLYKLLKSINSQNLLVNDVIPQKHRIVEYVKHLKGSPTPPSLDILLSQNQFKKQFKIYYQSTSSKAKYLRKFYD